MGGFLSMVVSGAIIGAIAKFLMPGRDPGGIIITILLGIAGSIVGGLIGQAAGLYSAGEPAGWIVSIIGAVILLAIYRQFKKVKA